MKIGGEVAVERSNEAGQRPRCAVRKAAATFPQLFPNSWQSNGKGPAIEGKMRLFKGAVWQNSAPEGRFRRNGGLFMAGD
jgi:hypothetical protein